MRFFPESVDRDKAYFSAVAPLTVTKSRSTVVTFMEPIIYIHYSVFIKNPSETFNFVAYIEPMHYLAWAFVIIFSIMTPPFLYLAVR